jgi:hypothetical protein
VTVLELCGALLSGLSAALAAGIFVSEVFLCDTSVDAHIAAQQHFIRLQQQYPAQLLAHGISTVLPQDVMTITAADLIAADLHKTKFLLLTCGWPCNGWSRAGHQGGAPQGLLDHLDYLIRILSRLRLSQRGAKPLSYLLENVAFDVTNCDKRVLADYRKACSFWGAPLRVDDARFDAPTHAERLIWTNLSLIRLMGASIDAWTRDPSIDPSTYLDPHRSLRLATAYDGPGAFGVRYPCNVRGKPLRALPTLVAFEKADAFRGERDGVVLDHRFPPTCLNHYSEPNSGERARLLGFLDGLPTGTALSDQTWCKLFGRCFRQHTFVSLISLARAIDVRMDSLKSLEGDALLAPLLLAPEPSIARTRAEEIAVTARLEILVPQLKSLVETAFLAAAPAEAGGGGLSELSPSAELPPPEPPPESPPEFPNVVSEELPPECKAKMQALLQDPRYSGLWSWGNTFGKINDCEFKVGVDPNTKQCWASARRLPQTHADQFMKLVTELAAYGVAVEAPDETGFAAPVIMVPKKDHLGTFSLLRLVVDYRKLNLHIPPHRYPLPLPDDLFARAAGWTMYSGGDLKWGFWQCPVAKEDQHYTAFHGPKCLMMYTRMPMGLKRAPAYFQQQMERILGDTGLVFIDDVLTGSDCKDDYSNFDEHLAAVRRMLDKLLHHGLTLDPKKCHWAQRSIKFLGHTLSKGCVEMEPSKVAAILAIASPTDAVALRSWIHMVGYYQRLIPRFSEISEPLRRLLKNNVPYAWGAEQQAAFDKLRVALTSKPVLAIARPDCLFILSTDWSKRGSSAILSQIWSDGIERVIAYASRSHSTAETNYSSYKGEMMAAVWGVDHFQYYLTGRPFKLLTDHEPLTWLLSNERLSGIYYRWAMRLSEFDIEITYRPGSANPADLPSRFPLPDTDAGWDNFKSDIELLEIAQPAAYLALLKNLSMLEYPLLPTATINALYHQPVPSAGGDLFENEGYEPDLSGIDFELDATSKSELQYLMVLGETSRKLHPDIYDDEHVMRWLKEPNVPTPTWFLELPPHERSRTKVRAQSYLWDNYHEQLIYIASDGIKRVVPAPSVRAELVANAHPQRIWTRLSSQTTIHADSAILVV